MATITPPTLEESIERIRKNTGKGWVNNVRVQREVIVYIYDECGFNLSEYIDKSNHTFSLKQILEVARHKYVPFLSSVKTLRRWFLFFIEHRVTMAERRRDFFVRRRRAARTISNTNKSNRQYFTDTDIDAIKW